MDVFPQFKFTLNYTVRFLVVVDDRGDSRTLQKLLVLLAAFLEYEICWFNTPDRTVQHVISDSTREQ